MRRSKMALLITACVFAFAVIVLLPSVLSPAPVQADTSTQPRLQILGTLTLQQPRIQLATPAPAIRDRRLLLPTPAPAFRDRRLLLPTPPPIIRRPPVALYPRWDRRYVVPTLQPQPRLASCGDTLQNDEWVRITAPPSDTGGCFLTIHANPGSTMSFTVNPVLEGLGLQVQLANAEGEELFSGATDSPQKQLVITYTSPPNGEVTLSVYAAYEGEFEIAPQRVYFAMSTAHCGGPLTAGIQRAGIVSPGGEECWYKYDGQEGRVLTVSMTTGSAELDPLLKLYDAAGDLLATDDDSGGARNAELVFALPATEKFTIIARDYRLSGGGPFQIEAGDQEMPPTPTAQPTTVPTVSAAGCGGTARMGVPVAGQLLAPTQKCVYTYSGVAGQIVKITLVKTSDSLDTYLELYDANYPSGSRLAFNDDNPAVGGRDSQIDSYSLGSTGNYKIVVSSYAGRSTGAYRLTVAQP